MGGKDLRMWYGNRQEFRGSTLFLDLVDSILGLGGCMVGLSDLWQNTDWFVLLFLQLQHNNCLLIHNLQLMGKIISKSKVHRVFQRIKLSICSINVFGNGFETFTSSEKNALELTMMPNFQ